VLVLLAAAPLAIASNVLRVGLLVVLVAWSGPEVLETWVHPASGMMTFALALPVIFWLGGPSGPSAAKKAADSVYLPNRPSTSAIRSAAAPSHNGGTCGDATDFLTSFQAAAIRA